MKIFRLISLLIVFCFFLGHTSSAQIKTYTAQWKKVDELIEKKNLPRSAYDEVKKIYTLAKKEGQDAQVVKALIYMSELQQEIREENTNATIRELETEIRTAKEPAASLLKSLLARVYWNYFQNNRWKLYDRTTTVNYSKSDVTTWSSEDLHKKISELYFASLSNKTLLKTVPLQNFDAIIIKGNSRQLRPTLFDLLAHEALEYFKTDESSLRKPSNAFEISDPAAFADAPAFAKHRFVTADSLSPEYKALLLYQELIGFHLNDAKPDALMDVDIDRLAYVHGKAVMENKDALYLQALQKITEKYKTHPAAKQAHFLIASWHETKASSYHPLRDTTHRYSRIRAREILEAVVKDSSVKNEGWTNSYNLLQSIKASSFSFDIEIVNVPDEPFRSLVHYRNLGSLHFRLIPADEEMQKKMQSRNEEDVFWNVLLRSKSVRNWQQSLPATNDLQTHAVEIKLDALPPGAYYLLASSGAGFEKAKDLLGARMFYVSNISYINRRDEFFVLHRTTGQPLSNASVTMQKQEYNYQTSAYEPVKKASYTTDANGYFKHATRNEKDYGNYAIHIRHGEDFLNMDESIYGYYYYDPSRKTEPQKNIFFFTDRSIYRPGQIVHFKGIVLTMAKEGNNILPGFSTTIYLANTNYQFVDSLKVTTNEYGSFSGKFTLPVNTLNGNFQLIDKNHSVHDSYFSVEEYKRPKFAVTLDKIQQAYKAGDTIRVTGQAKAYAGNTIDRATISYRVVRQPRFMFPWYYSKWWMPRVEPMEIAHGITTTDREGKFSFSFTAIPDKSIDIKLDPLFDYEIQTDVTDINGETRSSSKTVTAGYKSLLLYLEVPQRLPVDSFSKIRVRTVNMNDEYQPSTLHVFVRKLEPVKRLIRPRYWEQPDQFVMGYDEYIRYFPYDEYSNESQMQQWKKEEAFRFSDSTRMNGELLIGKRKLQPGYYEVEVITKDQNGHEVKNTSVIELFDASGSFNKPEYIWAKGEDRSLEPGEKAQIQVGTSAPQVFLIEQTESKSKIDQKPNTDKTRKPVEEENGNFSFHQLNNNKKVFQHDINEGDRGGFGAAYFFVKHNRVFQFSQAIDVPWTNKELKMEYETFRDKTLPGSEERWKIKISGYKNEKVAAEMLASMYDASLDQFRQHQWNKPAIWPMYDSRISWSGSPNFMSVVSQVRGIEQLYRNFDKTYDRLRFNLSETLDLQRGYVGKLNAYRVETLKGERRVQKAAAPPVANVVADADGVMEATDSTVVSGQDKKEETPPMEVVIRKNFNETAFFFPDLRTDDQGNIEFSFTTPDALTKWKLQTIAHTRDLAFGFAQKDLITQKDLMVQPNMPRFLRQGDHMELSVKIANLSGKELTGQAELQLMDATTNQPVDGWFMNSFPNQYFTVAAGESEVVKFPIQVPFQFDRALTWRVVARAGNFSDGEEDILPVVSNKVLVTETVPLTVRGTATKSFNFEKLLQSGGSPTLQHKALTVEYTSNPAWYAIQALPYLKEYPYDCAEQVWNRYYANALASRIANSAPRIREIFMQWKTKDTAALLSNLQKNQELKSILLEETPWVLDAKSEAEQKRNIALLFDLVALSAEKEATLSKLRDMQSPNGGFVWFKGGPDDRYITQYIITGMGHLKQLGVDIKELESILKTAIPYLDKKIADDYTALIKSKADLKKQQPGYTQIQYLYMRSFFPERSVATASRKAFEYYTKQAGQFWMKQNKYMQGMIALALYRQEAQQKKSASFKLPKAILASLKETSIQHDDLGRYWKNQSFGISWYWWHAPIETQALLIEAFSEITHDTAMVDDMRTWLIRNKQTNNWRTTKATAEACYAMLLQGTDWLSNEPTVDIRLGNSMVSNRDQPSEAGTGYFKETIEGQKVKPEMGNIQVKVENRNTTAGASTSYGAVYWQYFEDMDKVTAASTPLQLQKKLFIEKNTDRGPVLTPVNEGTTLHVGDKIKVRIELKVDRDMEYVHMKDMRASALEPVNVISSYKWQGGLGYYESTKDASTNFFFHYLRKGSYVFEYPLFVTHTGNFSNGITTIQCMYAPEFTAHSEGVKIEVE